VVSLRKKIWLPALLLAALFVFMSSVGDASQSSRRARAEDDYYDFVNADWLERTMIRPDRGNVSASGEIDDKIRKTLMKDLGAMASSGKSSGDPVVDMAIEFYRMCGDFDRRDAYGWSSARSDYKRIDDLRSIEDLSSKAYQLMMDDMPLPFELFVGKNYADVRQYMLFVATPGAFLSDPSYYEDGNETGARLMPLLERQLVSFFKATGLDEKRAKEETKRALEFDAIMGSRQLTAEQRSDITTFYNPTPIGDFTAKSSNIDFGTLISMLLLELPDEANIINGAFFDSFDDIYNEKNFEIMKSWLKARFLRESALYLGRDFLMPRLRYNAASIGAESTLSLRDVVYYSTGNIFDDAIGVFYGNKYFGPDAKADIEGMIREEIAVYRSRLAGNDWLGEATREMAIRKLDSIVMRAGYPDKHHPRYSLYSITPSRNGGGLYRNYRAIMRAERRHNFGLYGTTPDRTVWSMPAYEVNAYYSFVDNSINFPAGILRPPFYSPEGNRSANLGAIGTVIGHEISHAFDSNGSRFDEDGNMRNWWTDEDKKEFERRSGAMVNLFDGIPYAGGKINGTITLGENIADAGGLSCVLEVAKKDPNTSLTDFFEKYAMSRRNKIRPELAVRLLLEDSHSPGKFRVNIQLSNCDEFYETYKIVETDKMYLAPERRVHIW
jgi:putative endopeptidase